MQTNRLTSASARLPEPAAEPAPPAARARAAAEPPAAAIAEASRAAASAQQAAEAVAAANRRLAEKGSELTLEFEASMGRMVFRLVDRETREVVRQIPSEEALAIARALADDSTQGVLMRTDA